MSSTATIRNQSLTFLSVFLSIGLITFFSVGVGGAGPRKFTTKERNALANFRPMVKDLLYLPNMETDEYLIKWLRARNLNLDNAKQMLEKAVNWRKENKIDGILDEDWSKFRKEYPTFQIGFDKDGRPITIYLFGQYDFRKIAIAGEVDLFNRYMTRLFEITDVNVRGLQSNVTDMITIFDLNGFNRRQHLCLICLSIYVYYVRTYEAYYPQLSARTYVVNMPTIFEEVMKVIQPIFSEHTSRTIQFRGFDKTAWSKELMKQIPEDQLIKSLGGTKHVNKSDPV